MSELIDSKEISDYKNSIPFGTYIKRHLNYLNKSIRYQKITVIEYPPKTFKLYTNHNFEKKRLITEAN